MIKAVQILGREGTYLNEIKAIYNKPTAKSISSKIRNETRVPTRALKFLEWRTELPMGLSKH